MSIYLNIGLARPDGSQNSTTDTLKEVYRTGIQVQATSVVRSATENTLVLTMAAELGAPLATFLAEQLGQEAIVQYNHTTKHGELFGPQAEKWGAFNPEFFMMHGGITLAEYQRGETWSKIVPLSEVVQKYNPITVHHAEEGRY